MALTRYLDSAIRDLSSIQLLADLLPERVGSLPEVRCLPAATFLSALI